MNLFDETRWWNIYDICDISLEMYLLCKKYGKSLKILPHKSNRISGIEAQNFKLKKS